MVHEEKKKCILVLGFPYFLDQNKNFMLYFLSKYLKQKTHLKGEGGDC